jgi:hypothetical protein
MTRDEYVAAIESGLTTLAENRAMLKLIALFPFLSSGILNTLAVFFVSKIVVWFVHEDEIELFCGFIDLRTSIQGKKILEAFEKNKNASTTEEKKIAKENLISVARDLIKLRN